MGHPLTIPTGTIILLILGLLGFPGFIPTFFGWAMVCEYLPMWTATPILATGAIVGIYLHYKIWQAAYRWIQKKRGK